MHLDVRRYFPSVDHGILMSLLAPRLRDQRIVSLFETVLESGRELYRRPEVVSFYGQPEDPTHPKGLPIGNLTSQWWGNLYLDGLDHFVKRHLQVRGYLRYMDDLVLFGDEPARLRTWRREIGAWLAEERHLDLNVNKGHVRSTELPQTYLGYRIERSGYHLGSKATRRFRRRLPRLLTGNSLHLLRALASWKGAMAF